MPKISAVISVFNMCGFLPRCVESVLAQTLEDIEILCVDEGSTDGSSELLADYAAGDPRLRVLHPAGGGGQALNAGLRLASGEFLAVLRGDDFLLPDTFEILYRAASGYGADVVCGDACDYSLVNGSPFLKLRPISADYSWYYRSIRPLDEPEAFGFAMNSRAGICRLSFLREKEILFREDPGASCPENEFFFQVFARTERLLFVPHPGRCCADEPPSPIRGFGEARALAEEYRRIRAFLDRHPEFAEKAYPAYYAGLFRTCHRIYTRADPAVRPEFARFFREAFLEIRDQHRMRTGLLTKDERQLLLLLLAGEDLYAFRAVPSAGMGFLRRVRMRCKTILAIEGWPGLHRRIRKRLRRH